MTRFLYLALLALPLVGACSRRSPTTFISGAETSALNEAPRVVPAGFTRTPDGTRMEMVTADGVVFDGMLQLQQQPVIVPLAATGQPLVGGGVDLVGDVAGGGQTFACRFRLRNPVRVLDGGGTGRCAGQGRQVDFLF
jgi:hypothetical protein